MCGVPYHAAEGYIARLIQKGYRVAICDQVEEPGSPRNWSARDHAHRHARHRDRRAPAALAREQLSCRRARVDGTRPAGARGCLDR